MLRDSDRDPDGKLGVSVEVANERCEVSRRLPSLLRKDEGACSIRYCFAEEPNSGGKTCISRLWRALCLELPDRLLVVVELDSPLTLSFR